MDNTFTVNFTITKDLANRVNITTRAEKFKMFNCNIPEANLIDKMLYITSELNNHPDGCYGCTFDVE